MNYDSLHKSICYLLLIGAICFLVVTVCKYGDNDRFSNDFLFGVSTSSFQVEGAWNISGKGESIWDRFTHQHYDLLKDGSNADVVCDSYHNIDRDVKMLKDLGVDFYRFSLSWTRILPSGFANKINQDGVAYYNKLINALLENCIEPHVVLFHWDMPVKLADIGGFTNSFFVDIFEDYARVAFDHFGDRVNVWSTFNEPLSICFFAHGSSFFPPRYNLNGISNYLCIHNLLKSHAKVYHMYDEKFRRSKGKLGITNVLWGILPLSQSEEDIILAQRAINILNDLFLHPIFSKTGDYPDLVKTVIKKKSYDQGYPRSRLPEFTTEEINYIRGTADFMGINHYSSNYVTHRKQKCAKTPSICDDLDVNMLHDDKWADTTMKWLKVVPEGLRIHLNYLKNRYDNPPVIITENGAPTFGGLNDIDRVQYINAYLEQILYAKNIDGCNVFGYTLWSLMDNYEWLDGVTQRFGIYEVDFESPEKKTYPRMSAFVYKNIIKTRSIKKDFLPQQVERNISYPRIFSNISANDIFKLI